MQRPLTHFVGWSPCGCTPGVSGHRTYTCRFLVDGRECGRVLSFPACRDPSAWAVVVGLVAWVTRRLQNSDVAVLIN